MIVTFFRNLVASFRSLFHNKYRAIQIKDEPDSVDSRTVYIVGEGDFSAFAIMLCPCGCMNTIYLNLLPGNKPTWKVSIKNKVPTIMPSIWRNTGCRSHFFVRSGEIVWAKNN